MKRILSKTLMAMMIAAGLAILVFGPRPRSAGSGARVHIQYWDKWTGLEGDQMKEIVDEFNNTVGKEKGIWVDFVSMSQIDRKTLISTAGGVPPDVAGLWDPQVLQFASMNALEPLDDYARQYGMTRDKYKRVYYDGCQYKGKLYAIPSTVWCIAMLWNKAIFQEKSAEIRAAGLDPDQPPKTIAELDKYAAAIDTWDKKGKAGQCRLHTAGAGNGNERNGLLVRRDDCRSDRHEDVNQFAGDDGGVQLDSGIQRENRQNSDRGIPERI